MTIITKTICQEVDIDVEIDMSDFNDDELIEEVESRNLDVGASLSARELITKIFHNRRVGQPYDNLLDELIYETIGRII